MSVTLSCAFGSPWGAKGCGPCLKCQAESDRLDREFDRGVFLGAHDADGYTPAERRQQAKKEADRGAA